jgi:peptidoglycan hydrolase-like protein with peptidoglycan-binding domain
MLGWKARDALGVVVGALLTITVLVNVLFMQSGLHPAPMFKGASLQTKSTATHSTSAAVPRPRPSEPTVLPAPSKPTAPSVARNGVERSPASNRVIALQRALAEYGYGQIKATGIIDGDTRTAIEKFERERKLPITGQATDRVVRELAAVTGRALE